MERKTPQSASIQCLYLKLIAIPYQAYVNGLNATHCNLCDSWSEIVCIDVNGGGRGAELSGH